MKLLPMVRVVLVVALALASIHLGWEGQKSVARTDATAQERAVAALPGVGQGWLDTLRMVAGDIARLDTITPLEAYDDGPGLLGIFEPWHQIISINVDMPAYFSFQRVVCGTHSFGYQHPVTLATPAAVIAHEFGHRFRFGLWPHGIPGWGTDTLPSYAQDEYEEEFADRFSRAMMALRGWDTPDSTDVMLNHVLRMRLVLALAR